MKLFKEMSSNDRPKEMSPYERLREMGSKLPVVYFEIAAQTRTEPSKELGEFRKIS